MRYRILWKRKGEDRACGWSELIFDSREDAEEWARDLNKKYPTLFHWAEEA